MAKIVSAGEVISRKYKLKKASDLNKGSAGIDGRHGYDGKVGPQGPAGPASRDGHNGSDGSGFEWKGNYKPDNSYEPNDVVHYNGSSYICVKHSKGKPPSGAREYWELMAEAGSHGGGGGSTNTNVATRIIYVTEATQLEGTLSSTDVYFLDGQIDIAGVSIVVPELGLNIAGHGFGVSGLVSSEDNHTMFVTGAGTFSGDLFLTSLDVTCTGTGSQVFDLDNQENFDAVEMNTVNFLGCTNLGELANYRQGLGRNVAWISCADGLTMTGAWSGGFAILDSIYVGAPMSASGVLFRAGAGLVIGGSFRSNVNILSLGSLGATFCDFAPANITLDAGFWLDGVRARHASGAVPNMPASSTKALVKNCVGIHNTYQGAAAVPSADGLITISVIDTLYQITNAVTLEDPYWFSLSNTNAIKSDSEHAVHVIASGTLSFTGANNNVIGVQVRKWDNSASAYVNVGPEYNSTLNGGPSGLRSENLSFSSVAEMHQDDRIEVWVKNTSGTSDVTCVTGGQINVIER